MKQTVLFLCPHSAAKSVLAAAYCRQLAAQYDLDLDVTFAGTEPDAVISPTVLALLAAEGIDVSQDKPHQVTTEELGLRIE